MSRGGRVSVQGPFVDRITHGELEISRGRHGRPSVADRLDRTCTPAGRRAFREMLASPGSDSALLESSYESIRFLVEHDVRLSFPDDIPEQVERYLDSRWATTGDRSLLPGRLEAGWIALRHPDLVKAARRGIESISKLLAALRSTLSTMESPDAPPEIRRLTGNMRALSQKLDLERTVRSGRISKVLAADHAARGRHRGDLVRFLKQLGELDARVACAELCKEGFVLPRLDPRSGPRVEGEGLVHPLHPSGAVGNPISLTPDSPVVFLTGPNMAGKSTWLRTAAICLHLAHCGMPVPARSFRFSPADALFTSFSPEDDLARGTSLFAAELSRVQTVVERVSRGHRVVAFFDEAFRGTNVQDARDATSRVIRALATGRRAGFVFSSHLSELAGVLDSVPGVRLAHFRGEPAGGSVTFDYRLRDGSSDQRLGMVLFRNSGLDALLQHISTPEPSAGGGRPE